LHVALDFRLIEVLQEMGRSDWKLAAMVCKTLWNYSCRITSSEACFGSKSVPELVDILSELLGELFFYSLEQRCNVYHIYMVFS